MKTASEMVKEQVAEMNEQNERAARQRVNDYMREILATQAKLMELTARLADLKKGMMEVTYKEVSEAEFL